MPDVFLMTPAPTTGKDSPGALLQDVAEFPHAVHLTDRVHRVLGLNPGVFTGPGTNTYLVGMNGSAPLLIDTGSGVPAYLPLLSGHLQSHGFMDNPGRRLSRCLLTHGHGDHVGGLAQLRASFPALEVLKRPWPGEDEALPYPCQPLSPGETISGPGYTLKALATPGHAPDHLCYFLEEEGVLFSGDVVLGVGTTVIPTKGGDLAAYLDTLRMLLKMPIKRIYPGHGPVIDNPQEKIGEYLAHRLARERQILAQLENTACTVAELVAVIYAAYPVNLYQAAGQSVQSHLDKLFAEGKILRRDGKENRYDLAS